MSGPPRARKLFGAVVGLLLALSSLAHALLGWPALAAALAEVGAGEDLVGALQVGWMFGSMAMLVFGLVVVRIAMRDADPCAVRFIAFGYLVFGIAAFLARDLNPHFLIFILLGGLLALYGFTRPPQQQE